MILFCSGKTAFRKSISKGLLASSPKIFLKPKSVYGFTYFAFILFKNNSFQRYKNYTVISLTNIVGWVHFTIYSFLYFILKDVYRDFQQDMKILRIFCYRKIEMHLHFR